MSQDEIQHMSDKENEVVNETPNNITLSPVLQHAVKCKMNDKLVIKCNRCDVFFIWYGSSTCMLKHIQDKHGVIIEGSEDEDDDGNEIDTKDNKKRKTEVREQAVVKFIIDASLPFVITENESFIELLALFDKSFKVPSRRIAAGRLLDQQYDNVMNDVKIELRSVENICITLDGWTSCQQISYLGITAHYFTSEYSYKNRALAVRPLEGGSSTANMCAAILEVLHSWKICSRVMGIVTDNASNMRSLSASLSLSNCTNGSSHKKLLHINCNAHIINIIVKQLNKNFQFYDIDEYDLDTFEMDEAGDLV